MTKAHVVIGANFGDEGKGLMTNFFTTVDETNLVVRFNGGAQAGHTVQTPDGRRHAFHHFGSGTFNVYARTLLSRFFVVNPHVFQLELEEIKDMGGQRIVFVDSRAIVTTPYDMMINQMIEESRGIKRHGSCGLGVNETIKRNEAGFVITTEMLYRSDFDDLRNALTEISEKWVPQRLDDLGFDEISPEWTVRLNNPAIIEEYLSEVEIFVKIAKICEDSALIKAISKGGNVIFEGAQGLLLDEDHYFFPFVTHSHTGLHNVAILAEESQIDNLDVTYVTRAYMTRHGAGPFPTEMEGLSYDDATNVSNMWQGTIRFGCLDLDLMSEAIKKDLQHGIGKSFRISPRLSVTCMDQINAAAIQYKMNDILYSTSLHYFFESIKDMTGIGIDYLSYGPTKQDVVPFLRMACQS